MRISSFKVVIHRVGKLAACLILGAAMLPPSAHSAPDYATAALSYNPVAFWQLNETNDPTTGSLRAYDSTGNGYNGTYGTASYNGYFGYLAPQPPTYQGFATGQGAVQCTAGDANSPVAIPALNLHTNAVTIAMWINPSAAEATFAGLFMYRTSAGDAAGLGFGGNTITSGGMAELGYTWNTNSAATYNFHSGLYPVVGTWQFAALVIQSNSATIYLYYKDPTTADTKLLSAVNPIAHNPEAFSGGYTSLGSDVVNGSAPDSTRVFNGSISDVAVYNSALTQDQILALFAAGVGVQGFAPTITRQPQSQYVVSGSPVVLSATGIGGTSPVGYQWQLNGTDVNLLGDSANFSGANSNILTIITATTNDAGVYHLILTNSIGMTLSSNATLTIQSPALVGEWLDGSDASTNLTDVSGYSLAANHGAYLVGGASYLFTNDVPSGKTGQSLFLYNGDTGLAISNSSTLDMNYDNTFDDRIRNAMTVSCWAKGWPGSWNPFVSKYGETTPSPSGGWQLRQDGNNNVSPCWTIRGAGGVVTLGTAVYNNPEDMAATGLSMGDTNSWHFYVGTYDAATGLRNLYVDGVLSASENSNVLYSLAAPEHLCIGARDATGSSIGNFFIGEIYDVRVYDYALSQSNILNLYGVVPPAISQQPQSISTFLGATASVKVLANGTPPLAYQWRLNGTNIDQLPDSTNFTGANSNVLSIVSVTANDTGSYSVIVSSTLGYGSPVTSSNATLTVVPRLLVGQWFTNNTLADVSGYQAAGTHDGFAIGDGIYAFTNDVPPGKTGSSLVLDGAGGIAIHNSSTYDTAYTNSFDDTIHSAMTVACWAKGWPGGWNPFVSKYGENGSGWQLRQDGNNNVSPCWTIRGTGGTTVNVNGYTTTAVYGNPEDMAATSLTFGNDGQWHSYVGTYNAGTGIRNLYVDGVLVAQETGNGLYNDSVPSYLCIGARDGGGNAFGNYFQGEIYDVCVCNYDWNSNDVAQYSSLPDPVILGQPSGPITAYVGGTRTISVTGIKGTAPITNQWQLNGTNLVDGNYGGAIITGASSNVLTISYVTASVHGVYHLIVSNPKGTVISSNVTLTVAATVPPPVANLVGAWLTGATNLADSSGYTPAGAHDGYGVNASGIPSSSYTFTSDVPPGKTGQSLALNGTAAIAITNSSSYDLGYTSTFDNTISNAMTVMFWAKGVPGGWNPWVSKYGESGQGWQLRVNNGGVPTWTIRGTGGNEDMAASAVADDNWHNYAGTFDVATGVRNLYIDGVLSASETGQTNYALASAEHLCIGGRDSSGSTFGNFFTGEIYGLRIYNTALSEAQINSFLTSTAPPSRPVFSGPPALYGSKFVLTWDSGTLLESTNVTGPWTPTGATSPYTNDVSTASQMFFKLSP